MGSSAVRGLASPLALRAPVTACFRCIERPLSDVQLILRLCLDALYATRTYPQALFVHIACFTSLRTNNTLQVCFPLTPRFRTAETCAGDECSSVPIQRKHTQGASESFSLIQSPSLSGVTGPSVFYTAETCTQWPWSVGDQTPRSTVDPPTETTIRRPHDGRKPTRRAADSRVECVATGRRGSAVGRIRRGLLSRHMYHRLLTFMSTIIPRE